MPEYEIGTIKLGLEIGYKGGTGKNKYIYAACPDCGKPRWVQLIGERPRRQRCRGCVARQFQKSMRGINNPNYKGCVRINRDGYRLVRIYKEDSLYCMAHTAIGYILEHRLIMARHIGRPLLKTEQVHHKNQDKLDNRIENLELVSPTQHGKTHFICHNCPLKTELRLLRWELKELREQLKYKMEF